MIVELPDEMANRWLMGQGKEDDDEFILAAILHAKNSGCGHPYCPQCEAKP